MHIISNNIFFGGANRILFYKKNYVFLLDSGNPLIIFNVKLNIFINFIQKLIKNLIIINFMVSVINNYTY